ncbi:chitinase [gamma proteobacterium IMCC1989]|nr:chitinase [gamma proteobacterium IMCC1989]
MYKKILLISSILLSVLMASSTYANNSGRYSWWNNFFGGHNHECHTHQGSYAGHYYWSRFFWWHNHCPNQAPVADAGNDQDVLVDELVSLDASASSDADGQIIRYRWRQLSGPRVRLSGRRSATASFTAPEVTETTELTFVLKVRDNRRARDRDQVIVTVSPDVVSAPPVADAGIDQAVDEETVVILDGTASTDPDNDITSYAWLQTAGSSVALTDGDSATASFTAPSVAVAETLSFELTVTDALSNAATDSVDIIVEPVIPTSQANVRVRTLDASLVSGVELEFYVNGIKRDDLSSTVNETAVLTIDADVDYSIRTNTAGFAVQVIPFRSAAEGGNVDLDITLIPRGDVITISGAGSFAEEGSDGAAVSFTTSDFVDANGNPVVGDIQLSITPVDVSQPATLAAFPGEFTGILESDGTETPIVSFGTVEYEFTANGESINLAQGATADVLIPIYSFTYQDGSNIAVGDTIPLWSLDEETGIWDQEGTGTVVASIDSPTGLALSATVSHFSWWNCDVSMNAARVEVTVLGTDNGTATVYGRTSASIGWRPSLVDTTIPVNGTTSPLPIPSGVETCLWAEVNFDSGSSVITAEQCVTPAANEQLSLTFGTGSSEPLDVLALPGDASDVTNITDYLLSPIDTIVISPVSVESQVTYSVSTGALPAGVVLSVINGTQVEVGGIATESGIFAATILATDNEGNTDEVIVNFDISPNIEPPQLSFGNDYINVGSNDPVVIDLNEYNLGGLAVNWSLTEAILPAWLTFNNNTGELTIDPTLVPLIDFPSENDELFIGEESNYFYSSVNAINISGTSEAVIFLNVFSGDGIFIEFTIQSDIFCGELEQFCNPQLGIVPVPAT